MVVRIIRRVGFPYGAFSVFLAMDGEKKVFVIKANNKIIEKSNDTKAKTKKEFFRKAKELEERSVKFL